MRIRISSILFFTLFALVAMPVFADPNYQPPQKTIGRYLAVLSDLHMGLGKINDGWHPNEDFRWPKAFAAFLLELRKLGGDRVDLVIAGDLLELWQKPDYVACEDGGAGLGCSIPEMVQITRHVVRSHADTFKNLANFSQEGENRIHVIPGNHDAALMLDEVWNVLRVPLKAKSGRIQCVKSGVWKSHDGRVIVEHGHQIPGDLNYFDTWPDVVDTKKGLLFRPEGELLVHKIFNDVEHGYPIIDNLSPLTLGIWYRIQDRGVWGNIADIARLIIFYRFQTSLDHKLAFLGKEEIDEQAKVGAWDLNYAREELGWKLVAYAIPRDSRLHAELLSKKPDHNVVKLRKELAELVMNKMLMSDDEVRQLCDQAWQESEIPCFEIGKLGEPVRRLPGVQPWLLRRHLEMRRKEYTKMSHFIYGHTHKFEVGHNVRIVDTADVNSREIHVVFYNSGAFQRLMDADNYKRRLADNYPGTDVGEGLRKLTLEKDFRPCYTCVLAPFVNGFYKPDTKRWFMDEAEGKGKIVGTDFPECEW